MVYSTANTMNLAYDQYLFDYFGYNVKLCLDYEYEHRQHWSAQFIHVYSAKTAKYTCSSYQVKHVSRHCFIVIAIGVTVFRSFSEQLIDFCFHIFEVLSSYQWPILELVYDVANCSGNNCRRKVHWTWQCHFVLIKSLQLGSTYATTLLASISHQSMSLGMVGSTACKRPIAGLESKTLL